MKNLVTKFQDLSQKAAKIVQAVEAAPGKAAQLRDTLLSSAAQTHAIASELQSSIGALRADNQERLVQVAREIDEHSDVLEQAGYGIEQLELDVSIQQRVLLHLLKIQDVHPNTLSALASENVQYRAINAVLTSLVKAEAMADAIGLAGFKHSGTIVVLGSAPSVRLCWQQATPGQISAQPVLKAPAPIKQEIAPKVPSSSFGTYATQSSFFEPKTHSQPPIIPPVAHAAQETVAGASIPTPATKPEIPQTPEDPLARFKKMPDLSRSTKRSSSY
jgi:hypothetical protein